MGWDFPGDQQGIDSGWPGSEGDKAVGMMTQFATVCLPDARSGLGTQIASCCFVLSKGTELSVEMFDCKVEVVK